MDLEEQIQEALKRHADDANERAEELEKAAHEDISAEVDGLREAFLTTSDGLRIQGSLDGLREAVLMLARDIDTMYVQRRTQ